MVVQMENLDIDLIWLKYVSIYLMVFGGLWFPLADIVSYVRGSITLCP